MSTTQRTVSVRVAIVIAAFSGACKYARPDDVPGDGSLGDANVEDAENCFGAGIGRVCLASPPAGGLALEAASVSGTISPDPVAD